MSVPVYVPESVDLSFLKPRLRPAAQWFLHSLYAQQVNKRRTRNRPVPLYSKILERMMGRNYAKIIASLVAHEIVERGPYRNGKHSRLYRLTDQYATNTHRRVELTGKVLCRKIAAHRESERAKWLPATTTSTVGSDSSNSNSVTKCTTSTRSRDWPSTGFGTAT